MENLNAFPFGEMHFKMFRIAKECIALNFKCKHIFDFTYTVTVHVMT